LVKPCRVQIPIRQDWQKPNKIINPNVDLWFMDWLGIHDCFGAGIYGPSYNYSKSIPMGSLSTVFLAEVMAILQYTELLSENLMRRRIHICCDSRAALVALAKITTESSLVWECMQSLGRLSGLNMVTLVWIPGHQGIPGNEEAVRLAKEGAFEVPPNQVTVIPFSIGQKLIKKHLELEHQARWAACASCRQSKTLMGYPLPGRANELLAMSRNEA
jgi:hypothetical protein